MIRHYTPDIIQKLGDNEIFVFGSNPSGGIDMILSCWAHGDAGLTATPLSILHPSSMRS